eukprot:CAMPEP_0195022092 /NCGR_PEP_ID=MMETSP0326_2-20130528/39605_1 /TAXON_ID=2866 ORGANISM="Crypthecodinium cohnii, Strain Seligo" /NCGR_SAMPLE_ID=MMETSP0326_2 /ASSEMBLY_ACC=CAM_ASM_000348 /LENGTH=79 /DNA_ID=CAMNT_0040041657 /DNA_START=133 /DNA_END=372 /DNA_ORIENTATION=-
MSSGVCCTISAANSPTVADSPQETVSDRPEGNVVTHSKWLSSTSKFKSTATTGAPVSPRCASSEAEAAKSAALASPSCM